MITKAGGDAEYFVFLRNLKRTGLIDMCASAPCLAREFDLDIWEARDILFDWLCKGGNEDETDNF